MYTMDSTVSIRSEECSVVGAYFNPFWCHFHVLIGKRRGLAVFQLTVTLRMISNNCRSFSSIGGVYV
jgi:hypothetical protein